MQQQPVIRMTGFAPRVLLALPALALMAVACGPQAEAPAEKAPRQVQEYSIETLLDTTNYSGGSFSPDGSNVLVSSNETGIYNAYALPVDGGDPVALTSSEGDSIFALGYFPSDERFLYTADQGGNELNHVYVQSPDGSVTDITPGDELKAQYYGWAQDDATFFVATNERDARFFDLYEVDPGTYERTLFFQNDEGYSVADVSPDRRWVALTKNNTNADSDIFLHDRESGETQHLTPHEGEVNFVARFFSPDGAGLYLSSDEGSEFAYLVRHDLASGEREIAEQPDWDVAFASMSKSGKYLIVGVNNDARTEIRLYDTQTDERIPMPSIDGADITSVSISRDETKMTFYGSSATMPRDLFVADVGSEQAKQLTRSLSSKVDADDLVEGEVVRFSSFDGVEIPGILYKPHQASAENKVPALVWVHGGPGGQTRIGYSSLIQFLVNHGYAVYGINNRGSSGYGKTFYHLDDQDHGNGDLDDCVTSKQMLVDTGWVDPERIGIIGGSYGGFMVLAALTFRPEEFDVGVDIFGVSNWVRTLQDIPEWWESIRVALEKEMGDFDDTERLASFSPLFHADKIVKPLIVLQGANDPRVKKEESDEIVEAARANGVPVEYVLFEDEGHGFVKKENQAEGYQAILDFLEVHLKGDGALANDMQEVAAAGG